MDIRNIFTADDSEIRRSHLKNLLSVAMADGHLDDGEWEMLTSLAQLMQISDEEVEKIRKNPDSVNFVPPKRYEDKVQQVQDLVALMTIDGHISPHEVALCKKISLRLDILPQLVDRILADILEEGSDLS